MRVLFDNNVPRKLRRSLIGHDVRTVREMTWHALENGDLLTVAEAERFDLLVTCDQNLSYQQNLKNRKLALVLLSTNNWNVIKTALQLIRTTIENAEPCSFHRVDLPELN